MVFTALQIVNTIEFGIFCREITASQIALFCWAKLDQDQSVDQKSLSFDTVYFSLSEWLASTKKN